MRTLVIGTGVTGRAVIAFLGARGEAFDTFDDRQSEAPEGLLDGSHHFHRVEDVTPSDYGRAVVSPGLPRDHALTERMRAVDVPVISEIELAFAHARGTVIGITGSNGKSTTAALTHHLLEGAGLKSSLCGNIGTAFISCIDDDSNRHYVVEVSSFQLERVVHFRPQIGMLINISPDHLTWHGGFEPYAAAKLRLFAKQGSGDTALVDPHWTARVPGAGEKIDVPGASVRMDATHLHLADGISIARAQVPLLGDHNHLNALFACRTAYQLGVSVDKIVALLPSFTGLEHRMERVGEREGRLWINDTKATNVQAGQAAVDSMNMPYVLILGGCDKGERFDGLDLSVNPPKHVIAYGETASIIMEDLAAHNPEHIHLFRDACLKAHAVAEPGEAVLLAPACASFDQFDNFAQRGRVFKQIFAEPAAS